MRFVVADPEQFGQGEAGQHRVGDEAQDVLGAEFGVDGVHLRLAALIAPDQRGTNHRAGAIHDDQAMHLAGKSDALHLRAGHAGLGEHAADGKHGGVPPVLGALLGP